MSTKIGLFVLNLSELHWWQRLKTAWLVLRGTPVQVSGGDIRAVWEPALHIQLGVTPGVAVCGETTESFVGVNQTVTCTLCRAWLEGPDE